MENHKGIRTPHHIAIILDGNRRWAKAHGLSILEGHLEGAKNLGRILETAASRGIKILTVYAFSTENQKRSKEEISGLFRTFREFMIKNRKKLQEKGVRLKVLGDLSFFPQDLQREILETVEMLKEGRTIQLNMALNYGGRLDIVQAVKKIMRRGTRPEELTEDLISKNLYTSGDPEPDMIIRPGGEMRLSNFLIWQASYSELYFTSKFWPEFDKKELDKALEEFNARERRFGR